MDCIKAGEKFDGMAIVSKKWTYGSLIQTISLLNYLIEQ